jgi:hypothetical protein
MLTYFYESIPSLPFIADCKLNVLASQTSLLIPVFVLRRTFIIDPVVSSVGVTALKEPFDNILVEATY